MDFSNNLLRARSLSKTKRGILLISFLLIFIVFLTVLVSVLSIKPQTSTSPIFSDRNGKVLFSNLTSEGFRYPQTLNKLPLVLPKLLVSAEDENFYSHFGVDLEGIARALILNFKAGRIVSGGSTITQQLSHQLLFPDRIGSKTLIQKLVESVYAVVLDLALTKEQILEEYLNRVYFGRLAYGIEAAAQQYFDKSSTQLDLAESSALLAMINSPGLSDPRDHLDLLKERQKYILERGLKTRVITSSETELAILEPLQFAESNQQTPVSECLRQYLVEQTLKYTPSLEGLTVQTTLNQSFLDESTRIVRDKLEAITVKHQAHNAATVSIEPASGQILSYVCNVSFTPISASVDLINAPRQPGSAIKPITYLTALKQGYTPASVLEDSRQTFYTKKGEAFVPEDYDQNERGVVTLREALASSLNIPSVELLEKVGLENFFKTANVLGIQSFANSQRYDLAITLGGGEVTLIELTTAYATMANQLNQVAPYIIQEIRDGDKVIYQHQSQVKENILGVDSEALAFLISDLLSDNQSRRFLFPEVNPLVTSQKSAAKTGTTQDFRDSWTFGYTSAIAMGVWVGNADNTPMQGVSGVMGAAPIWHDLMEMYFKNGFQGWFEIPDGVVQKKVCRDTHNEGIGGCRDIRTEYFLAQTVEPNEKVISSSQNKAIQSRVAIMYPYSNQTLKYNPFDDLSQFQKIIFKAQIKEGDNVNWILDGKPLGRTPVTGNQASYVWTPTPGDHLLQVNDWQGDADVINFKVVQATH